MDTEKPLLGSDTMKNAVDSLKNITDSLKNMKDDTAVVMLSLITWVIILCALVYYFYYSGTFFTNSLQVRECNFMDEIYDTLNGKIHSIVKRNDDFGFTLKDYYIKSAYNCCSAGSYKNDYVNLCYLKNILRQGVRGLDFQIFSINDKPVVATSTSDSYCVKETFNYVPFVEVMNVIRDYAFSLGTAPNPNDPIILHLRIQSTNQTMYNNFATILKGYDNILLGPAFSFEDQGKNLGNLKLTSMMNKVAIIVDRSNNSFLESKNFYEYVNMTSNSIFARCLHYYDIKYTPDMNELIEFNKLNMTIGLPDKGSNPPNPSAIFMRETGCQFIGMRYQIVDANVEESDIFFDEAGSAFVLKPEKLRYIPIVLETPPAQDPAVSYATRKVVSDNYSFEI